MLTRERLVEEYLDWVNNYLTVAVFAEHRGLTENEGRMLIELAKSAALNDHPDS